MRFLEFVKLERGSHKGESMGVETISYVLDISD